MSKQQKPAQEIIEEFIDRKLQDKEYTWGHTCKRSARRFLKFIEEKKWDLSSREIDRYDLEDFIRWLQSQPEDWADESINNMVFATRELLKYGSGRYNWKVVFAKHEPNSIYSDDLELPSGLQMEEETGEDILYVRDHEHEAILDECSNFRDQVLIRTLYDTGCRPSEIRNLKLRPFKKDDEVREDLFEKGRINVDTAKRDGHDRYIYITPQTRQKWVYWLYKGEREAYSSCAHSSDYVFPTQRSEKIKKGGINRQVKTWAEKAGVQEIAYKKTAEHKLRGNYETVEREFVRINAKSYRHAFAVRSCRNGIALPILADLMGHASTESLKHYTKFYPDDLKSAWEQYTRD